MTTSSFYQEYLSQELGRRCAKNPRYSTRAFAKALSVDVGALSRLLSGKQIPSYRICETILSKLELSPREQKRFLTSVAHMQKERALKRTSHVFEQLASHSEDRIDLSAEIWHVIADWHHGAIMELTFVEGFKNDPRWIARELGISEIEAKLAVNRLMKLNLLKSKSGVLQKTHEQVSSADKNVTSAAHKKLLRQVFEKAITSMENDPIESRNMTSMVMAIDPEKMPEAKRLIQEFTRSLCSYLESGKRKQVYQLGIGLYPLQKPGRKNV